MFFSLNFLYSQNCAVLYSYGAYFTNVHFFNQSTVQNAHYFWNFGDGTGSNDINPVHNFPDNGHFLVTLFALDTISHCSSYYESWLTIVTPDSCQPDMGDSVFTYNGDLYITMYNLTSTCSYYEILEDGGPALNFPEGNWIYFGGYWQTMPFRLVTRLRYISFDSAWNVTQIREGYHSDQHLSTSAKNYDSCSANFEFITISADSAGARVLFTAMNKNAVSYDWYIAGFGDPIHSTYDTISIYYPYNWNDIWQAGLSITGPGGCKDSLFQNILVRNGVNMINSVNQIIPREQLDPQPNPFPERSAIDVPDDCLHGHFQLYDMQGRLIREEIIEDSQLIITHEGLEQGIYIFNIISRNGKVYFGKLIAE